jgi:hypothetical protein
MTLRQRLENLPVGQKLLAALLVLLVTILLVANLTFISAAYWITQESMAPQALQTIGRLVANPQLAARAGESQDTATALLKSWTAIRRCALRRSMVAMVACWPSCNMATRWPCPSAIETSTAGA